MKREMTMPTPTVEDLKASGMSEAEITDAFAKLIAKAQAKTSPGLSTKDLARIYGVSHIRAVQIAGRANRELGLGVRTRHGWRFQPEDVEAMRPKPRWPKKEGAQ
jgi:hypothetical protein